MTCTSSTQTMRCEGASASRVSEACQQSLAPSRRLGFWVLIVCCALLSYDRAFSAPKVAVFPLSGSAEEKLRERIGFSMRAKLDRDGAYEPIDGPRMIEINNEVPDGATLKTDSKALIEAARVESPVVLIWGEVSGPASNAVVKINLLDTRQANASPIGIEKTIRQPTDVRFVVEEILRKLEGVKPFEHMTEQSVWRDEKSEALWKSNPNLVKNPGFDTASDWEAIYLSQRYVPPISKQLPAEDRLVIYQDNEAGKPNNVLAMNMSASAAATNGLACLSSSIPIEPKTRYRLSYCYKSDGPHLHVFVKGYTTAPDINGKPVEREIYRRQVPEMAKTDGWVQIEDDMNPQHVAATVTSLRIDLYIYLVPGTVLFDDIVLKAVGPQTRDAKDSAIKRPATRPIGAR